MGTYDCCRRVLEHLFAKLVLTFHERGERLDGRIPQVFHAVVYGTESRTATAQVVVYFQGCPVDVDGRRGFADIHDAEGPGTSFERKPPMNCVL